MLTLAFIALGCGRAPGVASSQGDTQAQPAVASAAPTGAAAAPNLASAPFDVSRVIERVRYAYRAKNGAHEGGDATYRVQVAAGRVQLTPYHHPAGAPVGAAPASAAAPDRLAPRAPAALEERLEGSPLTLETLKVARGAKALSSGAPSARVGEDGELELARGAVTERLKNSELGVEQSWALEARPEGSGDLVVRVAARGQTYRGATEQGLHFVGSRHNLGFRYGNGTFIDAAGTETAVTARWVNGAIELRVPSDVIEGAAYPAVLDPWVGPEFEMDTPVYGPSVLADGVPQVSSNGSGTSLVVWATGDIKAARVTSTGQVLDPAGIVISAAAGTQANPSVAWGGADWLVAWHDARNSASTGSDIYGARVNAAGAVQESAGIPISTAPGDEFNPSVAYGATNWFVVWQDNRNSATNGSDIYGARVDAAGAVLEATGIGISVRVDDQFGPRLSYSGTDWLVVWADYRNLATTGMDIYGCRVSGAGAVREPAGLPISTAPESQGAPAVSGNATNWFVVWEDNRNTGTTEYDIYGTRVSATDGVLPAIAISRGTDIQRAPAVARDALNWIVVWEDHRNNATTGYDIYGGRVTLAGAPMDGQGVAISATASNQGSPAIAYDGTYSLIVWSDQRNPSSNGDIYGARVSSSLVPQDGVGILISKAANSEIGAAASFNGRNWLVVWRDDRSFGNGNRNDVYGARVSPAGSTLDPSGIGIETTTASAASAGTLAVASDGADWLVVWDDDRNAGTTGQDIFGMRVSSGGLVLDPTAITISGATASQTAPVVAHNGTNYLVSWIDTRNSGTSSNDIYGCRINSFGSVLDVEGIPITTATGSQYMPALASGGTNWLVVWRDSRNNATFGYDIYGVRVDSSGARIDASDIAMTANAANAQTVPAVASDGTNWLVVWQDSRNSTVSGTDIYGARVPSSGAPLDTSITISTAAGSQMDPTVAFDGTNWVVAWEDGRNGANLELFGARVGAGGEVQDSAGFLISSGAEHATPTLSAGNSGMMLVAYSSGSRLKGRLMRPECTWLSATDTTCDGVDDNCNGTVDENYAPVPTNCGAGVCARTGTSSCSNGVVQQNCTAGSPTAATDTTCDGIDEDCSGAADEDYVGVATSCGVGVCARTGTSTCVGGAVQQTCTAGAPTAATDTTCNGTDEDCSGAADEDYVGVPTNCGTGVCARTGTSLCVGGAVQQNCTAGSPTAANDTTCNGIDEDCSGAADEDYVGVTTSCGMGACAATGTSSCVGGAVQQNCTTGAPAAATDTTCNGVDEDCSGAADEDYVGVTTNCGAGVCARTGTSLCVGGAVQQNCTAGAPTAATDATCDGADEDCSGVADEDYVGVTTSCGVGACAATATSTCVGGAVQQNCTVGSSAPNDVTCDGVDDDCDGTVDEDYVQVATSCGAGVCARTGTSSCVGGAVRQNCTAGAPSAGNDATCNGIDEDCSGTADEDYLQVATSCGVGPCARTGTSSCVSGVVQENCTAGTPAASDASCDGVDQDCSGVADEDYVPVATSCGAGACAATGTSSCASGVVQLNCTAGTPAPSDASCNGVDDDCSGGVDEDYVPVATSCGLGVCARTGTSSCVSGVVQQNCAAGMATSPNDTSCNGTDEDCSGTADEDYVPFATSCGAGACARTGTSSCVSGVVQQNCTAGTNAPSDPTCDGVDDDCDGTTDEEYVPEATSCGVGACATAGTSSCVSGVVQQNCTAGTPAPSDATCDNVDDDCDGTTDEEYAPVATGCGIGACEAVGATACSSGTVEDDCLPGSAAAADATCDGIDDDCSGAADEDYVSTATTCGSGACTAAGTTSCSGGAILDSCEVDLADTDGDTVPDCSDLCPTELGILPGGCPETGTGGAAGAAGAAGSAGTAGSAGAAGTAGSTAQGGAPGVGGAGQSGAPTAGAPSGGTGGSTGGAGTVAGSAGSGVAGTPASGGTGVAGEPATLGGSAGTSSGTGGYSDWAGSGGEAPQANAGSDPGLGGASGASNAGGDDKGGCGCRTAGSERGSGAALLCALALVIAVRRRRARSSGRRAA